MTAARTFFFPIRHHSPACTLALVRALDEIKPRQVLVEAPIDFTPLSALLTDPATRPPVAVVSLPEPGASGEDGAFATYPFCAHSPEFAAMSWAKENGAGLELIDLPVRHPAMRRRVRDGEQGPTPLIADWRLDHNAYVGELCVRRGVPDALALWDALFEAQVGAEDWRGFFKGVGLYCRHIREATDPAELEADGTLAREAHMRMRLSEALGRRGPIAVVTGGFHSPALEEKREAVAEPSVKSPPPNAYLIRYGFQQLDRFSGYGAGLPHPAWYDRLWRWAKTSEAERSDLAAGVLADFAAFLRKEHPQLALSTPSLAAALLSATRLAALRDLPAAGRIELIDAVRSAGVKEAIELGRTPLLDALHEFLTGEEIGEVPAGIAQPPIVEAVRTEARALGFSIADGARKSRDLDILRKPRHAAASRFLFALELLDTGFATRTAGPDPLTGWRGEALFETWAYAWSPMVESRLISRASDGQTLEQLCTAELDRRRRRLMEEGRARSASAAMELLVAAVRTGFPAAIDNAADVCLTAALEDAEAASLIRALSICAGLARPGPGAPDLAPRFSKLRSCLAERLLALFPHLADVPEDRAPELIRAIAELGALAAGDDQAIDREQLGEALKDALGRSPSPLLHGALVAFASLIGVFTLEQAAQHVATLLDGAYVEASKAGAALSGCLAVSPRLIVHSVEMLAATDSYLDRVDADSFIAVLPELRFAFSQLTPSEVDRVAGWAASRHGLQTVQLLDDTMPAAEIAENIRLSAQLEQSWREDGLGAWLEVAP